MKISKELLEEVLINNETFVLKSKNNEIKKMWLLDKETNLFMVDFNGGDWFCINIYELAHKCKEWALSKGYDLVCKIKYKLSKAYYYECNIEQLCEANLIFYYNDEETSENSEVEAIIKACEWVLEEIKE